MMVILGRHALYFIFILVCCCCVWIKIMISCWFFYIITLITVKMMAICMVVINHIEILSLERTEVFLCPIKAYLSNTVINLCMVLLNFSLFCFILYCYAFVLYCNVNTVQYNAMHTFVGLMVALPF